MKIQVDTTTKHGKKSCGMSQILLATGKILGMKFSITLTYKRELLSYIQSVHKQTEVCDL